ncbi:GMC family oxidoreductase [Aquabacterium sp. NJ1]|uniref:GMC family oxidoreductase n=1 Tax=Aquabacterium sp. NJ1 TaxID=1538295 RepID=UPI00052CC696|nr:GMC family oxidoreductase [Aquabacterium sp. NJ1]KGM40202.1 GMC family oxidoreductase [Aquabacterium sp. NJ1]
MSKLPDPFVQGLASGWKVHDARTISSPTLTCDVVIIGSGAGGGITAEMLTQAGLDVLIVEEGPLKTSTDFRQNEAEAYATLYQEGGARQSMDRAISILQGRCVGGSTVVNYTTSFRTPADTLAHWRDELGLKDITSPALQDSFAHVEQRLHITPWDVPLNRNNSLLEEGLKASGRQAHRIQRNVKGCWNLGSCGMGCPTNAKQSMLVTTLPAALQGGARLVHNLRAERFEYGQGKVQRLIAQPVALSGDPAGTPITIQARHYVLAAGGINAPALLLRSDTPDGPGLIGRRTFLHPVAFSAARFDEKVEPWAGAPQTVYTDDFVRRSALNPGIGFKIEAIPLHPGLASVLFGGVGQALLQRFQGYGHTQMLHGLLRDGFEPESQGGRVHLNLDGSALLHYPLTDHVKAGFKRAWQAMADIQFASGAREVLPLHEQARPYTSRAEARQAIPSLSDVSHHLGAGSAHVMGGCPMGATPDKGVVDQLGRHWTIGNLSIHDGSVLPTSVGANPQLSIYGLAHRFSVGLVQRLTQHG